MSERHSAPERLLRGSDAEREAARAELAAAGPAALPELLAALRTADADGRFWLVAALAGLPGAEAGATLARVLADPAEHEGVRAAAALALGERGEGVEALLAALADPGGFVGLQAGHALARLPAHGRERLSAGAVPALVAALGAESATVRAGAARALAAVCAPDSIPALIAALDDPSPAVEFYAGQALERMGVGSVLLRPDG